MFNLWNVLDDVMRNDPWFASFPLGSGNANASSWPLVDVAEADTAFVISAELPGVKLEDVKLEIKNDILTLTAQKQPDNDEEQREYHRGERRYGTFTRSFALPRAVQGQDVEATMKDGVLTIHLPKVEQARPRHIPIQVASGSSAPAQITAEGTESTTTFNSA